MASNTQKLLVVFFIILIIFGIGIRFLSLHKDITGEETDFVKPALAISETGKTTYYHSQQQPSQTGLIHPPMYMYLLSLTFGIFQTESSARIVNVIFSLLTAILIFFFCDNLLENKHKKLIGLLAAALFSINYYVFSSSMLIDIDVLSMFFLFAFILFILLDYKRKSTSYFILAAISLFFAIFNRPQIAFLAYVAVGIYYLINSELRKSFWRYFMIGLFAGKAFILVWAFISTIIEPGNFFTFLMHNARLGGENLSGLGVYLGSFILNISQSIRLFTLPIIILMILSFFYFIKNQSKMIRILLIYSLSILILFMLVSRPAFGYPRYFLTMFPAVFILLSLFIYENLKNAEFNSKSVITFVIGFALSLLILFVLQPQLTVYESSGLIRATNLPDFIFNIFASLPIILIFFFNKLERKKAAIIILLALSLSYSLYFNISYVNHDSHIKEAGSYLEAHTSSNDFIISPKAVGYYTERNFYVNDLTKPPMTFSPSFIAEYFSKSLENRKMDSEFFWNKGYFGGINLPKPSDEFLSKAAYVVLYHPVGDSVPEAKIGDFYIYKLNN